MYFVDGFIEKIVEPKLKMLIFGEDLKHKLIEQTLNENSSWPPITKDDLARAIETHINLTMVSSMTHYEHYETFSCKVRANYSLHLIMRRFRETDGD
jgi:hypothetical protein